MTLTMMFCYSDVTYYCSDVHGRISRFCVTRHRGIPHHRPVPYRALSLYILITRISFYKRYSDNLSVSNYLHFITELQDAQLDGGFRLLSLFMLLEIKIMLCNNMVRGVSCFSPEGQIVFRKDLGVLLRAKTKQVVCLHSLISETLMARQYN
jgi:hypothetical protein